MNKNYITFEELDRQNICNCFTLKPFDFKDKDVSNEDFKIIEKELENNFDKIVKGKQEHTNNVKNITEKNIGDVFLGVDGLITNLKNVALVTCVADCQAILLYDDDKKVIGNIHSGWKGTVNKIIVNAINIMKNDYGCNPNNIQVYFYPCIMKECFEVEEDVKKIFEERITEFDVSKYISNGRIIDGVQKYNIDTLSINKEIVMSLGISKNNIYSKDICTKCNSDRMHSYRHDNNCGRNIALICLN